MVFVQVKATQTLLLLKSVCMNSEGITGNISSLLIFTSRVLKRDTWPLAVQESGYATTKLACARPKEGLSRADAGPRLKKRLFSCLTAINRGGVEQVVEVHCRKLTSGWMWQTDLLFSFSSVVSVPCSVTETHRCLFGKWETCSFSSRDAGALVEILPTSRQRGERRQKKEHVTPPN